MLITTDTEKFRNTHHFLWFISFNPAINLKVNIMAAPFIFTGKEIELYKVAIKSGNISTYLLHLSACSMCCLLLAMQPCGEGGAFTHH